MMLNRFRLVIVLLSAVVTSTSAQVDSNGIQAAFDEWKARHKKTYQSIKEEVKRFQVWVKNNERILLHNSQVPKPKYSLGHNAYSDMTEIEFAKYFKLGKFANASMKMKLEDQLKKPSDNVEVSRFLREQVGLPDYVNWLEMGAVTPVKNQGACGACWAFSTTGALEGARFVKTGELVSLSEQNLLDCDHVDLGCNGGLMDNAFKFDKKAGGLCSEEDYPYKAKQNRQCFTNCTIVPGSQVRTFIDVPPGNEKALLSAIAMQPVSVAIEASAFSFQFYRSGILSDDGCGRQGAIDHGVLAVGYGTDPETQDMYFLVKNSWGESWGDNGYVKIGRNSKNEFGICSILKLASFPIVE